MVSIKQVNPIVYIQVIKVVRFRSKDSPFWLVIFTIATV